MSDFAVITHTHWDEAPRIRHQVTDLIIGAGHRVWFFERPRVALGSRQSALDLGPTGPVRVPTRNLLHHQVRILPALHHLNAVRVRSDLRGASAAAGLLKPMQIINFAHDYWFLRDVFPGSRITTIIHDDFESQSRLPFRAHITWSLRRTCMASDVVFAVSEPLRRRLSSWCDAKLFLPWALDPYRAPRAAPSVRRRLLFWGHVDTAIDPDVVRRLSSALARRGPEWGILVVGPTASKRRAQVTAPLAKLPNVEILDRTSLDRLPLEDVIAAILPYRDTPAVNAVTLANKSMQLLARGLPLMVSGMPNFLDLPFVVRMDGEAADSAIDRCIEGFEGWQGSIRAFLEANGPDDRLRQLGIERSAVSAG
jgi:hypothetical protein